VANLEFSQDDITGLARKLSTLQPYLSQQEYTLLLAIFAAAAAHLTGTDAVAGTSTLPKAGIFGQAAGANLPNVTNVTPAGLQEQLLTAYIPGNYFGGAAATDRITGGDPPTGQAWNPAAGEDE
jgi:hypothetical protein